MALPVQRYTQYKSNPTSSDGNQHWDASPVDGFPWLFIGSLSAAEDHHHLQENNIKRILTVARRLSVVVPDFILEHCVVEVDDHPGANFLDSAAQQCKDFIDTAQTAASSLNSGTEEGGEEHHTTSEHSSSFPPPCVLVHCASGISRSASAIITWLMDPRRGLTLNDALAAIRTNRPAIHPNIGFMMQMQILEKHGGNLTNAVAEWNDKTHTDIYERVSSRRHKANDIHAAADELEVKIQKFRSLHCGEKEEGGEQNSSGVNASRLLTELNELSDQLDMYHQEFSSETLPEDRVTKMISKSARNKIENLVSLLSD